MVPVAKTLWKASLIFLGSSENHSAKFFFLKMNVFFKELILHCMIAFTYSFAHLQTLEAMK